MIPHEQQPRIEECKKDNKFHTFYMLETTMQRQLKSDPYVQTPCNHRYLHDGISGSGRVLSQFDFVVVQLAGGQGQNVKRRILQAHEDRLYYKEECILLDLLLNRTIIARVHASMQILRASRYSQTLY